MNKKETTAWDRVLIARKTERPKSLDYINKIFTNIIELHGDRAFGDDKSIVGGIAKLNGIPVTVIGEQKGKTAKENIDTPGAYPGMEAEERGQGEAIARNLLEMSKLKVPTISVVIGFI